jgi:hypothetical protein
VTHYYVWYRVCGATHVARATVDRLQDDVAARTGVRGRLLARVDEPRTWMEIYENVADAQAFDDALDEAIAANRANAIAEAGTRHTERFAAPADEAR